MKKFGADKDGEIGLLYGGRLVHIEFDKENPNKIHGYHMGLEPHIGLTIPADAVTTRVYADPISPIVENNIRHLSGEFIGDQDDVETIKNKLSRNLYLHHFMEFKLVEDVNGDVVFVAYDTVNHIIHSERLIDILRRLNLDVFGVDKIKYHASLFSQYFM